MSVESALGEPLVEEAVRLLNCRLTEYVWSYPYTTSELADAALYAVESPGRRWRPILFLKVYEKLSPGNLGTEAYAFACSIEYLHTASLILDDLPMMDGGELRRGRKSCHSQFGAARALLTAFYLCDIAQHLIHKLDLAQFNSAATDLEDLFRLTKNDMMRGQVFDIESKDQSLAHIIDTYGLKSGSLYALSAAAPAHMIGHMHLAERLQRFGSYLGIAYQISDDICDQLDTPDELGKDVRQDEGKSTIPRLYGVGKAIELAAYYRKKAIGELEDVPTLTELTDLVKEILPFA